MIGDVSLKNSILRISRRYSFGWIHADLSVRDKLRQEYDKNRDSRQSIQAEEKKFPRGSERMSSGVPPPGKMTLPFPTDSPGGKG